LRLSFAPKVSIDTAPRILLASTRIAITSKFNHENVKGQNRKTRITVVSAGAVLVFAISLFRLFVIQIPCTGLCSQCPGRLTPRAKKPPERMGPRGAKDAILFRERLDASCLEAKWPPASVPAVFTSRSAGRLSSPQCGPFHVVRVASRCLTGGLRATGVDPVEFHFVAGDVTVPRPVRREEYENRRAGSRAVYGPRFDQIMHRLCVRKAAPAGPAGAAQDRLLQTLMEPQRAGHEDHHGEDC
jgi:hypothetical protein